MKKHKTQILKIQILLLVVFVLSACSSSPTAERSASPTNTSFKETNSPSNAIISQPLQILFIGNSYTFYNKLPEMLEKMLESGGYHVEVEQVAQGGWGLADHLASAETLETISGNEWDFIILQEKSMITNPELEMYPAIRGLHEASQRRNAQTILFMTWGWRDGFASAGLPNYERMQTQLIENYSTIADELGITIAPVGIAWSKTIADYPEIDLYDPDGSHPSLAGSFLAASVFYAVITGESIPEQGFPTGLKHETSSLLQHIASSTVHAIRQTLTFDQMMNGFEFDSPVQESALTIPTNAAHPAHIFEGRLVLEKEETSGEIQILSGSLPPTAKHLPEFDFEFIQQDGYLVPVRRGLIITEHPQWNYILEPGRVWQEDGDQGFTRASFPFALVWKGSNAIMNGTMTFLFNNEQISQVWYQITQETTIGLSADFWGLIPAVYLNEPVENAEKIKTAFVQELADRYPTKSIQSLAEDYPEVDLSAFGEGVNSKNMTWYGFVINGINYIGGCRTRYGSYPYCEYMRAPSYSTAKSAFASLALMRLAQKYDPNISNFYIKDYVPEAADSPGDWRAVTFDHTLDMATGNFETSARMVDEEHWDTDPFWYAEYYAPKIAAAFDWPHKADPGTTWVYRTFDTFIVTRAMHNYLQTKEGSEADIFDFVVEEIYSPLKMGPGVYSTLRTKDNNWQGQAYGGYGLWWIPDDLAKISDFLNVDHGIIQSQQILHPDLLSAALQQNPEDRGVIRDGNGRYNNAFWADEYQVKNCQFWVPHMYGYSGIVVALIPNGTTYYYASDGQEFTSRAAIQESAKLIPICP